MSLVPVGMIRVQNSHNLSYCVYDLTIALEKNIVVILPLQLVWLHI